MSYSVDDKKRLLAECLDVKEDTISSLGYNNYFELDDGSEYLVLD